MSLSVTVAVATYGEGHWHHLAHERAIPSAMRLGVPVAYAHADSLHEARNEALAKVNTEWVVHLDADDELEPGFFEAMEVGTADLRAPSVRYCRDRQYPVRLAPPFMPKVASHAHECTADCLPQGNWLVVGSMVRADMVRDVGGWEPWPVYEDWALWLRCWKAGATVEAIPDAVYRAYVRRTSRNRAPEMRLKNLVHHDIVAAVLGEQAAA